MGREEVPHASPHGEVGTIGQFVRGKTSLAAAIVKVLAGSGGAMLTLCDSIDEAPGEAAEIAISAAHLGQEMRSRRYGQIDCPGYADAVITGSARMGGAILVELAAGGAMSEVRGQITLASQTCWLTSEDKVPKIGSNIGKEAILESLESIGAYISQSKRPIELSYLMPITSVFPISGHGMLLADLVEQRILVMGQECENFGIRPTKLTVTDVAIYSRLPDLCQADEDVVGVLPCGTWREGVEQGQSVGRPGSVMPHTAISSASLQWSDELVS